MADNSPQSGSAEPWEILVAAFREAGAPLPDRWASAIGHWDIPDRGDRPYVYVNFLVSRDCRVSFNEPGNFSPVPLALGHRHDAWLMGLLRARADVVMVGDGTLRADPQHVWRPEYVSPPHDADYAALRRMEGLDPNLPLVLVSLDADLPPEAAQFSNPAARTILATTARGASRGAELAADAAGTVDVLDLGEESVDMARLMSILRSRYGVRRLVCEGGPRVYGSLLAAGVVDDEFLTLSPMVIGADAASPRPSLVEGVAFRLENAPVSRILGVARNGDFLFLRSRYSTPGA